MRNELPPISPSERLLCGPGPSNVDPAALEAMQKPMLGHLDPELHEILLDVVDMLRRVYRAQGGLVLPLQATGTSGMEAGLANLVEPGETVIVGSSGYFGARIAEIARRCGAEVVEVSADWGEHVPNERLLAALDDHPDARLLAVVHGETSTGCEHPLEALGAAMRGRDTLLMADCVTTLGGVELDFDGWGIDYAYSCTQKCLAAPPGMSPVAVSDRALERIRARRAAGPVLDGPAAPAGLLGGAPRDLPPHGAHPPHLCAPRGRSGGPSTRVSSGAGPGTPRPGPTSSS